MRLSVSLSVYALEENVWGVADGPHDADLCTLKYYQLLRETQLLQTECAMVRVTMNRQCHRRFMVMRPRIQQVPSLTVTGVDNAYAI